MKATAEIKKHIEGKLENNHTLKSVLACLLKNLDEHGTASIDYPAHGFRIHYTSNDNFQQGVKNGGGAGMYASLRYCGFFKTVKIELD